MTTRAHGILPLSFTFIVVAFGLSSLGCFSLKYHMPSSNTPAAVIRVAVQPVDYIRFDVFHSEVGCPRSNPTVWNSDYLGSIEIRYPNQSFEIPGSGYSRIAYRGSTLLNQYFAENYSNELTIASTPGAQYSLQAAGTKVVLSAASGTVAAVTCEDGVPVRQKPTEERMASRSTPIRSSMLSTLP
ncbi:MAG: hypothetical protein P8M78_02575 [Myxococcota bacterium]|nr:hypothetical protein [Myxococcota bacterium]